MKNNIKVAREKQGLTQQECAELFDVKLRAWQTYEQGVSEPRFETLCKIADKFNVTTDYLLGRPTAEPPEAPIDEFARAERLKELERIIIKEYLELGDAEREAVLEFIRNCVAQEEERKRSQKTFTVYRAARENPTATAVVEKLEVTAEELQKDREKPLEDWDL